MSTSATKTKAPSASKELTRQQGNPSVEDLELAAEGVEVDKFLVDVAVAHGVKADMAAAITEGYIERSIEGASVISVTIHDGTKEILRGEMFGTTGNHKLPVLDVQVDGVWYRLASFQKHGMDLTLEFEDRIVWFLRTHNTPLSASRAHTTRAEFIGKMVNEIRKATVVRYFCPELHKKQPIEGESGVTGFTVDKKTGKKKPKTKKKPERQRQAELAGGLLTSTDLKMEGETLNKNQLQICEEVLDTGSEMGASKKVLISSIMCIMQESSIANSPGHGGVDVGPFDQNVHDGWPASNDVPTDARAYFKQAIANDKKEPQYTLQDLVQSVQRSGAGPSYYAKHREDAEKVVAEYGEKGIAASTGHERTYVKEFDFHRGPPDGPEKEDSWEASGRLAREVNWRRFVVGYTFYFVQDSDLMSRKPVMEIEEEVGGIETIDGIIDAGITTSEATVQARATRWWAPPGSVVKVKNCGPLSGRWLVFKIKRDLFTTQTEITIHQPEAAKPEKAGEKVTVSKSNADETLILGPHISLPGGTPKARIVEAAKWGLAHKSNFIYAETRPMPKSLFDHPPLHTDCSGFATLCYKAAGVKDPNKLNYNGEGFTGTLRANGNKSNTPEPGDLVFYASPEHVAVYIGDGKVIEFGGPGGPHEEPIHYRNDLLEVRNYSMEEVPWAKKKNPSKGNDPPAGSGEKGPTFENNLRNPIGEIFP